MGMGRVRKATIAGFVLLGSFSSSAPASAGIFGDDIFFDIFDSIFVFYDSDSTGWGTWTDFVEPDDVLGLGSEALLVAVFNPVFEDLFESGCLEVGQTVGTAVDFVFDLDLSGCIELSEPGPAATAVDDDFFPLAGFLWLTFDSEGQPNLPECLSARSRVTTDGQFPAGVEFVDLGPEMTSMSAASTISGLRAPDFRVAGSGETSRKQYVDPLVIPMFFGTQITDEAPPETIGPDDGVWEVGLTFSECSLSDSRGGLDLDYYLRAVESEGLPNTR